MIFFENVIVSWPTGEIFMSETLSTSTALLNGTKIDVDCYAVMPLSASGSILKLKVCIDSPSRSLNILIFKVTCFSPPEHRSPLIALAKCSVLRAMLCLFLSSLKRCYSAPFCCPALLSYPLTSCDTSSNLTLWASS